MRPALLLALLELACSCSVVVVGVCVTLFRLCHIVSHIHTHTGALIASASGLALLAAVTLYRTCCAVG